ncbi:MAG: PD-(D/E)XK nuclease family protein, partial [Paracoccaceae bacterium]
AKYILKLRPLDPLAYEADARDRGKVLHAIVEEFTKTRPEAETPEAAKQRLLVAAERHLSADIPWPATQRLWLAGIAAIADKFVADEAKRVERAMPVLVEGEGAIDLAAVPFRLTARPDRIDLTDEGELIVYDYKSGIPPSEKQLKLFDKQLSLEAAMAERGAFSTVDPCPVREVAYIRLGGAGEVARYSRDSIDFDAHWERFEKFIASYFDPAKGYTSRRAAYMKELEGSYDHLARAGEWKDSDPAEPEDVG